MHSETRPSECFPPADSSAIKVAIIYEDFDSGARAKDFAERLAEGLECSCPLSDALWRSELLDCQPIAEQAARHAEDCDYLIVSLRGDRVLSFAARQWIEAQLDGAAARGMWLVALSSLAEGKPRALHANRHYFRGACAANGVPFFSHTVTTPTQRPGWTFSDREPAVGEDEVSRWPRMPLRLQA